MSLSLATAGLIGAGITAGAHLLGGLFGARSNKKAAEKQMDMQQDLINRQNVYNSPANQMRRLQESGLNPNLVYGGGNVTGNQSGTGSAPTVASSGDYGLSKAVDSINTYMAINNHDMDMQLKNQSLLNNDVVNKNNDLQAQAQLEKTKTEDKVLKSQLLTNQMTNDILKHDAEVITGKKIGLTSHERGKDGLLNIVTRKGIEVGNNLIEETKNVYHKSKAWVKNKFFRK